MEAPSFLFTSESVTEGHPDKICDRISDTILDACLAQDPHSRVAIESAVKDNTVYVFGELTTNARIDTETVTRNAIRDIGYIDPTMGFSADGADVVITVSKQSEDIAHGVGVDDEKEIGAGDQGMMFGYATSETPTGMPLPITLAHRITKRLAEARKNEELPFLRPDGKSQVTVAYDTAGNPVSVPTVVVSTQHTPDIDQQTIRDAVIEHIIKPTISQEFLRNTTYHINPSGRFVIGGPVGDSGLTGRKIIVDTYGGMARHGGGAFSGKDATKVDRSGAYAARQVALSIVKAGFARTCELQIAYAIGISEPVSLYCNTFGTGTIPDDDLVRLVAKHVDLRPRAIIDRLGLRNPLYAQTSSYGHFGRPEFPWEQTLSFEHMPVKTQQAQESA